MKDEFEMLSYVACISDRQWWVGLVVDKDEENKDIKIQFMHPPSANKTYFWPKIVDNCWVLEKDILMKVVSLKLSPSSFRHFQLDTDEIKLI